MLISMVILPLVLTILFPAPWGPQARGKYLFTVKYYDEGHH